MKRFWKRNAVVSLVLVLVCVAVYLNWRYAGDVAETQGKTLGESVLVNGEEDDGVTEEPSSDEAGSDYFATARLTRQQARDSALTLLQEAAAEENADQSVLDEAAASIQVLASYTLSEAQIENLVTAKGYADCVTFMNEDSISVVVAAGAEGLTATDVAKITDIVITETGYRADQIKIMDQVKNTETN